MQKPSKIRYLAAVAAIASIAACSGQQAPQVDDALRNDLSLAAQVRAMPGQQFVGPAELGAYPQGYYAPGYGTPYGYQPQYMPPQPYYQPAPVYQPAAAPAPAPRRTTSTAARSSSSGTYSAPAPRGERVIKNTKRDAAIGAVAGAAIGVATASKQDRLKGGLLGAVIGGTAGAIIGNNVDVKRVPIP